MQGAPTMKKLIVFALFLFIIVFSDNLFAIPHSFFINAFTGFSAAERQNGSIRDGNGDLDKIDEYNFGGTAPVLGVGLGYYLYYFSFGLELSQRLQQTGSGHFIDNTSASTQLQADFSSRRFFFVAEVYPESWFHQFWRFHFYVLGGIGFAWNNLGLLKLTNTFGVTTFPGPIQIDGDKARGQLAYKVGLGAWTLIVQHLAAYAQYNYMNAGNINSGTFVNLGGPLRQALHLKFYSNEFLFGLTFMFN